MKVTVPAMARKNKVSMTKQNTIFLAPRFFLELDVKYLKLMGTV